MKIRKVWKINPKTRIKKSQKRYTRERLKKQLKKLIENAKEEILKSRSAQRKLTGEDI